MYRPGHELLNLEGFEIGDVFNNNMNGVSMRLSDMLFESILHCVECWFYLFSKHCKAMDEEESMSFAPFRMAEYDVYISELPDDFKIRLLRQEGSDVIEISVMHFGREQIFHDVSEATECIIRCLGVSLRRWKGESEPLAGKPEFTVTDIDCMEMWNNTSKCIERTGECVCVFCNSKLETENEASIDGPYGGGASESSGVNRRLPGPEAGKCGE